MDVDTLRIKRAREQAQVQSQAKKPLIPTAVAKPVEMVKRQVTKTIGKKRRRISCC